MQCSEPASPETNAARRAPISADCQPKLTTLVNEPSSKLTIAFIPSS
jgi:hypothetical protein